MILDIFGASSNKLLHNFEINDKETVHDIKERIYKTNRSLYPDRQRLTSSKNKNLKDTEEIGSISFDTETRLYLKDLGPQIGWKTVFLAEYFGPLAIYILFHLRPMFIYGPAATKAMPLIMHISTLCHTFHYGKRLLETLFVHRFSHSTMPIRNLVKNCTYYWLFAAFIAYYNNHPLYTEPSFGPIQIYLGLAGFILCELGNFSIHLAFMNMRPAGSKERKIPMPTKNPFTYLFNLVSCPNYTYEVCAWTCFSIMSQSLPAFLFTLAGFYQMTIWAIGKHKNYRREFSNYPKGRKAIIPFII